MSELEQHHIRYKELHGEDEIILLTHKEHRQLHARLRKEGKCNVPAEELDVISRRARGRSPRARAWERSEIGIAARKRVTQSEKHKIYRKQYDAAYQKLNTEKISKQRAGYRAENREAINERQRGYRAANRDAINLRAKENHAKQKEINQS